MSRTPVLLLTLLVTSTLTAENSSPDVNHPDTNKVCITGLRDKLAQHDAQISDLKNQLQITRNELRALADKQLEHKVFPPEDCREVLRRGYKTSGMYRIKSLYSPEKFWVWCDLATKGGGWTYVLHRIDGSENFNRNWNDYKGGFGKTYGEFWLGLEHLHHLTNSKSNELMFELMDWNITKVYANYEKLVVGSEKDGYDVKILGKYSGNAGDSFTGHAHMKFSTPDRDQDTEKGSCARTYKAGWWFLDCFYNLLTGAYSDHGVLLEHDVKNKILWNEWRGLSYSLKQVKMMIRPTD